MTIKTGSVEEAWIIFKAIAREHKTVASFIQKTQRMDKQDKLMYVEGLLHEAKELVKCGGDKPPGYALKGKNRRFDSVGARKIHFKEATLCHFTNPRNLRSKTSDFRRSCTVRRELGKPRLRVQRRSRF